MFDTDRWTEMLRTLGCSSGVATAWAPVCAEFLVPERFSLGREEIDDFLAQIIHESAHLSRL
ncbi:MAG: hypothetical protein RLZZ524_2034, partial [Pseudomonadota bacterium]